MQLAAAVRTADGDEVLLTHAGLTVDAWLNRHSTAGRRDGRIVACK